MTATVRDPWADAHQATTAETLDADLSAVRRRLWARRAAGLVLGTGVAAVAYVLLAHVLDPDARGLWRVSVLWPSYSLCGLGFVLVLVGAARTSGVPRPFVRPEAFLSRADRTWLRTSIAENRSVPDERRAVVAHVARRMVVDGRAFPTYLGITALYVGLVVMVPIASLLVVLAALTAWTWGSAVREAVWAHRARRWLAQNV